MENLDHSTMMNNSLHKPLEYLHIMKKQLTILLGLFIAMMANAQTYNVDLAATFTGDVKPYKKGDKVNISKVIHNVKVDESGKLRDEYSIVIEKDTILFSDKIIDRIDLKYKDMQGLWDGEIIYNVLGDLKRYGIQEELRQEMEEEALDYISRQKEYGLVFNDPYLENYIYGLISKIAPQTLIDCRPGNVNILILDNPSMNAGIYPNGTMFITTGLISALHTEDELVAVLAHEIAHFVLDHSVRNVNAAVSRKKRAEFWAAVATGLTAVAEGVAAAKSNYYIPGAATIGMAALSTSVASQVIDRLGMNYNVKQEESADKVAVLVLEELGYDKNALSTALNRMKEIMVQERSNVMYFQTYSHPALIKRILDAGKPQDKIDQNFEQEISFAVTSTARMKFEERRFRQVLPLVNQNIYNGVATSEDYILKANCLLALHDDPQTNREILEIVETAKTIDPTNINIYKAEILANLRLKNYSASQSLLEQYIQLLNELKMQLKDIESDITWDANYKFVISERDWANRMLIKVKVMQ